MPQRPIGVADTASGAGVAQIRTRERTVGAESVVEQYLIPISERVASWRGGQAGFRVAGTAAVAQAITSLFNAAGSGVLVAVRAVAVANEFPGSSTSARAWGLARLTAAPTGGTVVTGVAWDTAQTQNANVVCRASASADGTNTLITATPGAAFWRGHMMRQPGPQTTQQSFHPIDAVPLLGAADPIILREGQGVCAIWVEAGTTTMTYVATVCWEEFTLP